MGAYLVPISAGELGSAMRDDIVWDDMVANHMLETHTGQLRSVDIIAAGWMDCHLCRLMQNYSNVGIV
jgi:hypothetical protein